MKRFTSILMLSFALAGTAWAQATRTANQSWTVQASTQEMQGEQNGNGPISNILDGNPETFWHSSYKNNISEGGGYAQRDHIPHYFMIDLQEPTDVLGFSYTPRNYNGAQRNGSCHTYKFYVSESPFDLSYNVSTQEEVDKALSLSGEVHSGNFPTEGVDKQTVKLSEGKRGRYVLFVITSSMGNFGNCAEFEVYTDHYLTDKLATLKSKATDLLNNQGKVGYPKDEERTKLQEVLNASTTADEATVNRLEQAVASFSNTENINLPISGKAYTIKAHFTDGSEQALYWDGSAIKNGSNPEGNAAVFVCRQVGNKYFFTNNFGKYLIWFDSGDGNKSLDVKGAIDTYDATHNDWTLGRATVASEQSGSIQSGTTNETLFGLLQMQAADKSGSNQYYLAARKDGAFIAGGHLDKWYDGSGNSARSFVFHFEEVSYPNAADLKSIEGEAINIGDATHIATFSAPFATDVPEGVKAYYVKADGVAADVAKVTAVGGNTIPANQGVLLTGKKAGTVTMLPATTAGTELTDNQLGHSAGAAKDLATEQTPFYILTKVGNKVGFFLGDTSKNTTLGMNKAYLKGKANSQAIRLVLDDVTTGVEETLTDAAAQLPVYDLSGRRAMQPLKKGIYIQGGKKFIVK